MVVCTNLRSSLRLDLGSFRLPSRALLDTPFSRVKLCGAKKPCRAKYPRSPRLPFDFSTKVAHRSRRDQHQRGGCCPHHTKGTGGWSLVSSGHPLTIPCRHNRPDVSSPALSSIIRIIGFVFVSSASISAVVPRHSGYQKVSYSSSTANSSKATS